MNALECSHPTVSEDLSKWALGYQYLTVTLCQTCPKVWVRWGYPLREGDVELVKGSDK